MSTAKAPAAPSGRICEKTKIDILETYWKLKHITDNIVDKKI